MASETATLYVDNPPVAPITQALFNEILNRVFAVQPRRWVDVRAELEAAHPWFQLVAAQQVIRESYAQFLTFEEPQGEPPPPPRPRRKFRLEPEEDPPPAAEAFPEPNDGTWRFRSTNAERRSWESGNVSERIWQRIFWKDGIAYAIGYDGRVASSDDGVNWTRRSEFDNPDPLIETMEAAAMRIERTIDAAQGVGITDMPGTWLGIDRSTVPQFRSDVPTTSGALDLKTVSNVLKDAYSDVVADELNRVEPKSALNAALGGSIRITPEQIADSKNQSGAFKAAIEREYNEAMDRVAADLKLPTSGVEWNYREPGTVDLDVKPLVVPTPLSDDELCERCTVVTGARFFDKTTPRRLLLASGQSAIDLRRAMKVIVDTTNGKVYPAD